MAASGRDGSGSPPMEIDDMTAAEERMCGAFPRGQDVDVRGPADEDPARGVDWGADWGPERTVRAAVVRALLPDAVPGEVLTTASSAPRSPRPSQPSDAWRCWSGTARAMSRTPTGS